MDADDNADDKKNDSSDHENFETSIDVEESLENSTSDEEESSGNSSDKEEQEERSEKSSDKEESSENSSDEEEREESSEKPSGKAETKKQPISITVLSWNINGKNSAGFGDVRQIMVKEVVLNTQPDVILLQETYPLDTPAVISFHTGKIRLYYKAAKGEGMKLSENCQTYESQVLYNNKYRQIDEKERLFPVDSDVDKESLSVMLDRAKDRVFFITNNKLREGALDELKKVFNDRISIVGLRIKESDEQGPIMIFMSFHNVNTSIGADVRARAIEGFCQLVTELHKMTGCVVLAGADFNQQFVHSIDPIHPYPYPNILDYKPTSRRLRCGQIDYFILEPANCRENPVKPFDFIDSIKHGALKKLQPAKLYEKKVKEQPPDDILYETTVKKGIRMYKPYKLATIEDFDKMIPHDPLLCTFVVPG